MNGVNNLFFRVEPENNIGCYDHNNVLETYNDILPDISTSFKIMEKLRKECINVIPKFRKNYYHNYIDNIITSLNHTGFHYWNRTNDLSTIVPKVFRLFVLVVNYNIIINNTCIFSGIAFDYMNTILSQITMDSYGMLINNNSYLLDQTIDTYLNKLHNYINVML